MPINIGDIRTTSSILLSCSVIQLLCQVILMLASIIIIDNVLMQFPFSKLSAGHEAIDK